MPSIQVAFVVPPRHTPPGADVAESASTPCYEFVGTPPAIRWDAQLRFTADASTVSLYRGVGRTLVVFQRVRSVSWFYDADGLCCATVLLAFSEFFSLDEGGESARDTHTVGAPWSLECVRRRTEAEELRSREKLSRVQQQTNACRVVSSVRGHVELRIWTSTEYTFADRDGELPGRGYISVEGGGVDVAEPGYRRESVMESSDELRRAWEVGEGAAAALSTSVPKSSSFYEYTTGVEHCRPSRYDGIVPVTPDEDVPADLVNTSHIMIEPSVRGFVAHGSAVVHPSPGRWLRLQSARASAHPLSLRGIQ